jgi:pimeloyl-ACP methyl ester carboxylesterase
VGVSPLATDISAPFALREVTSPELASGWIPFVGSGAPIREGLFFIEPYRPGKVPVVMVHGLLSSPMSWVDLANDLRAIPGFNDHFQLWAFRYATGKPFLEAAARLRRDLYSSVATVDPGGCDPALRNIVLVGHSMGGLVCQLQASYSEDRLWSAIANRPLEAIVTSGQTRAELQELFFFDPQPNVRRVIQLATPHEGSSWANRPIGWIGTSLVRPDGAQMARHEQLRYDNPGVFAPELERRVPTSIDMLNPNSVMLQTIAALRTNPCVQFHTVYGYGRFNICEGPGDGIVSRQSASFPRAVSQLGVRATHTRVHRRLETADEVARILRQHLDERPIHSAPGRGN